MLQEMTKKIDQDLSSSPNSLYFFTSPRFRPHGEYIATFTRNIVYIYRVDEDMCDLKTILTLLALFPVRDVQSPRLIPHP
ncbi:hypothetical protein EVAR_7824_1 [Eumeta japonica]|uniref:Uncharacterized protein n=1 Tax=Eumeta variegata TaxID=151549 RepID=A0A4C1TUX3_EUMVA|nr:hypothetical protein EVAR_7824_1 [Eumeta japonica]